jgi:hypothetical protein
MVPTGTKNPFLTLTLRTRLHCASVQAQLM